MNQQHGWSHINTLLRNWDPVVTEHLTGPTGTLRSFLVGVFSWFVSFCCWTGQAVIFKPGVEQEVPTPRSVCPHPPTVSTCLHLRAHILTHHESELFVNPGLPKKETKLVWLESRDVVWGNDLITWSGSRYVIREDTYHLSLKISLHVAEAAPLSEPWDQLKSPSVQKLAQSWPTHRTSEMFWLSGWSQVLWVLV